MKCVFKKHELPHLLSQHSFCCVLVHRLYITMKILFTIALDITIKVEYWTNFNKFGEAVYFLYQKMLFPSGHWKLYTSY